MAKPKNYKKGYHLHHIDWNHKNNSPQNLISIPPVVHRIIHNSGVNEREEIVKLVNIFELSKVKGIEEIKDMMEKDTHLENIPHELLREICVKPHPKFSNLNSPQNNPNQLRLEF